MREAEEPLDDEEGRENDMGGDQGGNADGAVFI